MAIFGKNRHIYPRKIISRQKLHPPSYLELKFLILTKNWSILISKVYFDCVPYIFNHNYETFVAF